MSKNGIWLETIDQVREIVARYGITVIDVEVFGDDIGFTTRDKVYDKPDFFRDFEVDGIERIDPLHDYRLVRVYIYPCMKVSKLP